LRPKAWQDCFQWSDREGSFLKFTHFKIYGNRSFTGLRPLKNGISAVPYYLERSLLTSPDLLCRQPLLATVQKEGQAGRFILNMLCFLRFMNTAGIFKSHQVAAGQRKKGETSHGNGYH